MNSIPGPGNMREDAEDFGRQVGKRTAAQMVQPNLPHADLTAIGLEGISTILDWANTLATTGVDENAVKELTDAAAEAFHLELERAASLLCAPQPSGTKQ